MKRKNNLLKTAAILACLLCLAMSAMAQKRKPAPRKPAPKPAATKPAATFAAENNAAEIKAGAEKVGVQIKNVTRFIYLLGGIAQGIEDVDKDIKARKASSAAIELNTRNKQSVIGTLRNLRAGLAALETEFRANPALRTYLPQIQGITDISGIAEDQAEAGQFIESGRTLLQIIEKLSDTLVAMP
jgi:predicted xylose isomerase-like sugar epimerase